MARTVPEDIHPLVKLVCEDRRYKLDAYQFVREGFRYAQEVLELGKAPACVEPAGTAPGNPLPRHVSGQDLCHALRQFAHERFGYLAVVVLRGWGIHSTSDFGEIVYNLIRIGEMKKSELDRRADFDDVYDFERALLQEFAISRPQA